MKKAAKTPSDSEMLDDYDFSKGVRGKYVERYATSTNLVILEPDVAEVFPNSESVNDALRMLIKLAREKAQKAS
jgi:hypothetical protein